MLKKETAVVLCSGGQDSTTCLFMALNTFEKVHAVAFDYNQKHRIELESVKKVCADNNVSLQIIPIDFLNYISDSALIHIDKDVNTKLPNGLPASFVPDRNLLFLTIAHAIAYNIEATTIVLGVCETDYSGYPDCRYDFIEAFENTANLGCMSNIRIETPLMYLNKAETFQVAQELGVLNTIIEDTHTCYNGVRILHEWGYGCGECPSCILRKQGYEKFYEEFRSGVV
jgi:7-cyano-7-deazaguanine synthase